MAVGLCPFTGPMRPLLVLLLLGLVSCGSAQILFKTIKSVEYNNENKTILIPCFATNVEAKSLKEMYARWRFRDKIFFSYDGFTNKSTYFGDFSSARIIPHELLVGNASLIMELRHAVPGIYSCEVTEIAREGETNIELKLVKSQLLFTTIKSVDYDNDNETVLIPCLFTNSEAKSLKEMFVKWKLSDKYILNYDGEKNESMPTSEFSSAHIVSDALLTGRASLVMDKSQAVPGIYTCEVSESTKEGKTTIELKYGPAQLLFNTIESVEYTSANKTIIIPCLVTNVEAKSLREMFVKWKFGDKFIFYYDGDKNKSIPISGFSSAHIIPDKLLAGNASLIMDQRQAVPGIYTCKVTELTREGETTIELKFVKPQLLFTTIKSVEYTNNNKTVLIPCLFTNSEAKSLKEMFVKWKLRDKYIFNYDGEKNKSTLTSEFSSAHIVPGALLTGSASLVMDKSQAVIGIYTCEVSESTKEGKTTIELKYHIVKPQLLFTTTKSVEYDNGNETVLIPCLFTNSEAISLKEMFVKWKLSDIYIFHYDGEKNESTPTSEFSSAHIVPDALLTGSASLVMDKSQAVPGIYTCEVSESAKEGKTNIELKYVKTQLLFTTIKSVEYDNDNETVLIPCLFTNSAAKSLKEMFVKWKFENTYIFSYAGDKNQSKPTSDFESAYILPIALLTGNASLMMDKKHAVPGKYTCEVTDLTREGETTIELKYISDTLLPANDHILMIIFPMLAALMFWGSDIVLLKFKSNIMTGKIIILSVAGLILNILIIIGAIFFISGEYLKRRTNGLALIVVPTLTLMLLQVYMFMIAPDHRMRPISIILMITQMLGLLISLAGLNLCVLDCSPVHSSLLISGLGIIAVVAFLGLVYMIFVGPNKNTIQPNRKLDDIPTRGLALGALASSRRSSGKMFGRIN